MRTSPNDDTPLARAARDIIWNRYDGAPPWHSPIPSDEWGAAVNEAAARQPSAGNSSLSAAPDATTNSDRYLAIAVPLGGFRTNQDEARWLERTIIMRMNQMMDRAGMNVRINPIGLHDLLLLSLDAASRRGKAN